MKKIIKVVCFLIAIVAVGIYLLYFSYKLDTKDFITDEITFIYNNQNINKENIEIAEKFFKIKKIKNKEELQKIKDLMVLSYWKFPERRVDKVAIIDTGVYYPVLYFKLKKYFDYIGNDFYKLQDEYNINDVYAYFYRGLLFLGNDRNEIKKVIRSYKENINSSEIIEIINKNKKSSMGVFILNQEKTREFGISKVIVTGNTKDDKIYLDSEIYGNKEIIDEFREQPKLRKLEKFISKNTLYLSTKKTDSMLGALLGLGIYISLWNVGEFLPYLNGEMLIDFSKGNEIFGLNDFNKVEIKRLAKSNLYFNLDQKNEVIFAGDFDFFTKGINKKLKENQFLFYNLDTFYLKIQMDGYYEKNKLNIKSIIDIKKLGRIF